MYNIEERIKGDDGKTILVRLRADKEISNYHISYPIIWQGFVNGEALIIKQKEQSANSIYDYDFNVFPEKFSDYKENVVIVIDTFLKRKLK